MLAAQVRDRAWNAIRCYGALASAHCHQSESGLNQNINRDYDPLAGSYVESDPIGLRGGSYSTYSYVGDAPVSATDPLGLCPCGESYVDCLANCIRQHDPLNNYGKAALSSLGASLPKAWFDLPIQGSPYTTLPSYLSLGQGTAASGANLLRLIGRYSNYAWIGYGDYLAAMEVFCAGRCLSNSCAY